MALVSGKPWHQYSLADIETSTQNFDDRLVIGHGGFGKVYKGHIKNEKNRSTIVAIKRLDSMSDQGETEFKAEIEMLSRLRHSHLVSLLGFCVDCKEMILVYEYMPNGTLYHHLHRRSNTRLSWIHRLRISIGAARGLDYLHTGAGTKHGVIHRDVKSSNILLDEDWAAKISDFGLAKVCPINRSFTYVNTAIKGTFGYLDPEIFLTGKFTRKTDVFAFGVVLFELLSGRRAVFPNEDLSLARWAQIYWKKRNLDQLVAAELRGTLSPKSLKEFAKIAYRCLDSDPKERPAMSEVVVALQRSLALQEKFDDCSKPRGLTRFTWKMLRNFVPPTKDNSSHGYKKLSRNSKININHISFPAEGSGCCNQVLPDNEKILGQDLKLFSYDDLQCATGNFQNGVMKIGRHWVSKGWIHEKTHSPTKQSVRLAIIVNKLLHRTEGDLRLLGEFCHPNLHQPLGYGLKDGKLYLVHEFMENRSLKYYLRNGAETELSFDTRVKIATGVGRGLVFLQHKQLIIKDWILWTDNIWLDMDFNAKLFYFDVEKLVNRSLKGCGRRQCDVTGLGMLMMEILTGRPMLTKIQMELVRKEHLAAGKVAEMSDGMIKNLMDPQISLKSLQIERVHELITVILTCYEGCCTMEQGLKDLEQLNKSIDSRMNMI